MITLRSEMRRWMVMQPSYVLRQLQTYGESRTVRCLAYGILQERKRR